MKKPLVSHHDSHLLPPITQVRHRHPSTRVLPDAFKENVKMGQEGGCWEGHRVSREGKGAGRAHEKWRADIEKMITDRLAGGESEVERTKPRSFAPWTANQVDQNKQTLKHNLPHFEPFAAEPHPETNPVPNRKKRMSIQEAAPFKNRLSGNPQAVTGELPESVLNRDCARTTKLKGMSSRSRSLHGGGCRVLMPKGWAAMLSHPL